MRDALITLWSGNLRLQILAHTFNLGRSASFHTITKVIHQRNVESTGIPRKHEPKPLCRSVSASVCPWSIKRSKVWNFPAVSIVNSSGGEKNANCFYVLVRLMAIRQISHLSGKKYPVEHKTYTVLNMGICIIVTQDIKSVKLNLKKIN